MNKAYQDLNLWAQKRVVGLFSFNLLVMLLIVLRSAGYFDPYLLITINHIVFLSLILSIFLLGVKRRAMFIVALTFWILAGLLKSLKVEVWAERTAVYFFQAFLLGMILFLIEALDLYIIGNKIMSLVRKLMLLFTRLNKIFIKFRFWA